MTPDYNPTDPYLYLAAFIIAAIIILLVMDYLERRH